MKRVMMLLATAIIAAGMSGIASAEPKNDKADTKQAQHKDNKGKDKAKANGKKKHKRFLLF